MTTTKIVRRPADPLGYEGDLLTRLRQMAEDELSGIGDTAVEEEATVLRARLAASKRGRTADALDQGR